MADGLIQVPVDSTGKKVDTSELTVGANTVERQRIVISSDGTAAGLAGVKNTGPTSADYGLVVRNMPRKESPVSTTANLGIAGVFTSAWQDSSAEGTIYVAATARADAASAASGFILEESDDSANANFTRTVNAVSASASTTAFLYGTVRAKFWRIRYVNGGTGQTSFELVGTASTVAPENVDATGTPQVAVSGSVTVIQPTAANLKVDLSGTGANATALKVDGSAVTQPVSGPLTDTQLRATPVPVSGTVTVQQGTAASLKVDLSGTAANATAVKVDGSAVTQPVSGNVGAAPQTSGGCSDYHAVAAASTNAANIKASAGQVFAVNVFNNAAYPIYVKFHNTSGTPTAGTGVVHTIGVQAGVLGGWANPNGIAFATGIGISIVKGITDADATALVLSDCVVDVHYK